MKRRLLYLVVVFAGFLALFVLEKPLFMLFQSGKALAGVTAGDWFRVIWHGLPADICVAACLTLFPWITVFVSVWTRGQRWPGVANRIYFIFISLFLAAVFIGNMIYYPFRRLPIDGGSLMQLLLPGGAVGAPGWFVIVGIFFTAVVWLLINRGLGICTRLVNGLRPAINRGWWSAVMVIAGGLLVMGVLYGTCHAGYADFSNNAFLNHAAVNPVFSLFVK